MNIDHAHELKILPMHFREVVDGHKRFEIRRKDRHFQAGQLIRLREYLPPSDGMTGGYTGCETTVIVTYVLNEFVGLADGYCAFSFIILRDD